MKYNNLIFILRGEPFHLGHKKVIDKAITLSDRVTVLLGSANSARNLRNPFTFKERRHMIEIHYGSSKLDIHPLSDYTYNDSQWVRSVQSFSKPNEKTGLIGASKDNTSYYLKLFPHWGSEDVPFEETMINATDIRNIYFSNLPASEKFDKIEPLVPETTFNFLVEWHKSSEFNDLIMEKFFIDQYKKQWSNTPYPVTFVTTDVVLEVGGHILMIKRKARPGQGLWALPGGFLNQSETLLEGALRELEEETKIKVPTSVLKGSIINQKTFDDPNHDSRGRVITTAFHIKLENEKKLPIVRGSDDASFAAFRPVSDIKYWECYSDHFHMINYFLGNPPRNS